MVEFRISDFLAPFALFRTYLLLRRSERWRPEELRRYQAEHLASLLSFCVREVPRYSTLFREVGIVPESISPDSAFDCLDRLPVLEKEALRAEPDSFLSRSAARFGPKLVQTSGTTGTPLSIYWDRGSNVMELCCTQRVWRWAGVRPGDPFLDLRSRLLTEREARLAALGRVPCSRNRVINSLEMSADTIDRSNLGRYADLLEAHRPRLVRGHPQAIQTLAILLRDAGRLEWKPKAVTTASEALHDFQRRDIEETWGAPVLDTYGLKEHNVFIAQCRDGSYHVAPEYGICEIVDNAGRPAPPGEEGWIVATGLHNRVQPLLRYNTGDRAIAGGNAPCACGRTLPIVERLTGRSDDSLRTRDGKLYSGLSFAFFGRRGIRKARLVQESLDRVVVEVVTTAQFDAAERRALVDALGAKVHGKLGFELREVAAIDHAGPGKYKFVVSRISGSEDSSS